MKAFLFALVLAFVQTAFGQMAPQPQVTMASGPDSTWNLDWQSVTGRTYFLQYSEDLIHWNYFPDIVSGTGAQVGYGFASTGDRFFVRLRYTDVVTTDPENDDFDGDGLSNIDELALYGLDPLNGMTDGTNADSTVAMIGGSAGTPVVPTLTDPAPATPVAHVQSRGLSVAAYNDNYDNPDGGFVYMCSSQYYWMSAIDENITGSSSYPTVQGWQDDYWTFARAVEAIPFSGPEVGWQDGVRGFEDYHYYGENSFFNFKATHQQYRLVLDSPAPAGGYSITLVSAQLATTPDYETLVSSSLDGIAYTVLSVPEGQTKSDPVDVSLFGGDVDDDVRLFYIPGDIEAKETGQPIDFDGLCVTTSQTFDAAFAGFSGHSQLTWIPNLTTKWQGRRIKTDGTFESWKDLTNSGDDSARLENETITISDPGCYQIQYVLSRPDKADIEFPFIRKQDARSIVDSKGFANDRAKAGKVDYVGIAKSSTARALRDAADSWLGSTDYSLLKNVAINPTPGTTAINQSTLRSSKCNLFIAHIANNSSVIVPYYIRSGVNDRWTAPLATEDWYTNPSEHVTLTNFPMLGDDAFPAPGMVAATNKGGTNEGSGHVGFIDYDGCWINAGAKTVNKYIAPGNLQYSPVKLRDTP